MGLRRDARVLALQALYQWNLQGERLQEPPQTIGFTNAQPRTRDFARILVDGVIAHRDEIDAVIAKQCHHWRMDRLSHIDRNILRMAIFELRYLDDIPSAVTINEAIEIAKQYSDEASGAFVNGVLDGLMKQQQSV